MAARGPPNHAHTWAVDGRTSRERMQEAHISCRQGGPDIGIGNVPAQVYPEFKRVLGYKRRAREMLALCHTPSPMERPIDYVHLLFSGKTHKIHRVS